MSTRTHAQGQAAPERTDAPVQTNLMQRRHTNQAEDSTLLPGEEERLQSPDQSLDSATPRFRESRFNHDFSQVPVHSTAPPIIQTKLTIGQPGDRYEQEADRVAEAVMRMPKLGAIAPSALTQGAIAKATISGSINPLAIQRVSQGSEEKLQWQQMEEEENKEQEEEDTLQAKELPEESPGIPEEEEEDRLQAKELPGQTPSAPVQWEARLNASKGNGLSLPESVRAFMEPRFGYDLSQVQVHTDPQANRLASELNAKAFTRGNDIFFGSGYYQPHTKTGQQLLAHELTHTIQQRPKPLLASPNAIQPRTGVNAVSSNKELNVQAFRDGRDVDEETYNSESSEGKRLLAHELTQVRQGIQANKFQRQPIANLRSDEEFLQAKKLPGQTRKLRLNKQLGEPLITEEEEEKAETPQAKVFSDRPNKVTPDRNKALQEATASDASEQMDFKTRPEPGTSSEAAAKLKPVTEATPEVKAKTATEQAVPETKISEESKAALEKAPAPVKLMSAGAAMPQSQGATQASSVDAAAQEAIAQTPTPPVQPTAAATPPSVATAQSTVTAAPTMESGGASAEASAEMADSGAAEEEKIAAAAAEAPPGSAELEPRDRDSALASLAEDAGGGGEAAMGGGGGTGAAIPDKPTPPVPDVSQAQPSAALAAVSHLPPVQLQEALAGVSAGVGNSVGKQRAELAANPPQMERPSGSPMTKSGSAAEPPAPSQTTPRVEKTPEGQAQPVPSPEPLPPPPAPPTVEVRQPLVQGDAEGKLSDSDAQRLQASLRSLPTTDPGLQVSAGPPPRLELQGNADPQSVREQRTKLEEGVTEAYSQGQQDLAQPMGENEIYPNVPQETLRAEGIVGGAGGAGGTAAPVGGGAVAGVAAGDEAVSIIAQQEHGEEIQVAVAQSRAEMAAKQQEHITQVEEEKARSNEEIAILQEENATQQSEERAKALTEVQQLRSSWNKEQNSLVEKSHQEADKAVSQGTQDIANEQTQAEAKAAEHIQKGEEKAAEARRQGEEKAEAERQKGEEQSSGGIFAWLADKAKAFFEGIKQAIQKAFEAARAAVKAAIEGAQKLAAAAIEAGRQAIVGLIRKVGDALIAIGDTLLAAFPELRDRFRNAIKAAVKGAEAAVNALADTLKKGVQAALNLLGKGLDAALGLLEKGMLAAVDIAKTAVQGAIKLADAAIKAIGAFAVLAKDIAASPGQWLSNLGAGAMDGIKNHFWGAFQTAVKEWFSQKVEEVLGLGMTIWNVLKQGGINVAEVGKMAWEGIKSAIPAVLIQLLIEKVVSMIVPAAGTVLLIIEGLQAAWGTVSRILQAFERFMAFLKAVKTGQAGPPFGAALAAAGVVVIDFVSNWLLRRLRGPASKVAAKIREIAKKIGNKLKNVAKKLGKKFGKLKDKFFGKKGGKADKDKGPGREGDRDPREARKKQEAEQRLKKAQEELRGKLNKGIKGLQLKAYLLWLRAKYRLRSLTVENAGTDKVKIVGKINPEFEEWADKFPIVDKEINPEDAKKGVERFFRVMSINELRGIQRGQQLNVRVNEKGEGKKEFCIAKNKEYSKDLVTRQGDEGKAKAEDYDYSVMVEIEMTAGAMDQLLQDPRYGRTSKDTAALLPGMQVHQKRERGVIVLKMESNRTTKRESPGGFVINYVILSKTPADPEDPINKVNSSIRRISVVGGIAGLVTPDALGLK